MYLISDSKNVSFKVNEAAYHPGLSTVSYNKYYDLYTEAAAGDHKAIMCDDMLRFSDNKVLTFDNTLKLRVDQKTAVFGRIEPKAAVFYYVLFISVLVSRSQDRILNRIGKAGTSG